MLEILKLAFYRPQSLDEEPGTKERWTKWLGKWAMAIRIKNVDPDGVRKVQYSIIDYLTKKAAKLMKQVSPKYIPREWMLVTAYERVNIGDFSILKELKTLFSQPYDEQPSMGNFLF